MIKKVIHTIKQNNLFSKNDKILLGLSGGADSVSLLLCLKELRYNVTAVHINHGIRGNEALRDEEFCVRLCEKINIPLKIEKKNIPEISRKCKKGIEETARIVRYKTFFSYGDIIATAHTINDNIETVLFNFIRGTGLKGLCGIKPLRFQNNKKIVRPLIDCTREDIENFLKHRKQNYVIDSTNLSTDYTRNKIRLMLIPLIKEINPRFILTANNTLKELSLIFDFLENLSKFTSLTKKTPKVLRLILIEKELLSRNITVNFGKLIDMDNIFMKTGSIWDENGRLKGLRS